VIPVAAPIEVAPAGGLEFAPPPGGLDFVPPAAPSARPRSRRGRRVQRWWIKPAVLVGVLGCIGIGLWMGYRHLAQSGAFDDETTRQAAVHGYRLTIPAAPWKNDERTQFDLKVNPAFRRNKPACTVAILSKDYETRLPTEAEMVSEALDRLRGYFDQVEWEMKPKSNENQLGGQPAQVMIFEGTDKANVVQTGECTLLAHRGFGYWFFAFSPAELKDRGAAEWQAIKAGFTLDPSVREGWNSRPRPADVIQGEKAGYSIAAFRDLWKKQSPEQFDPLAEVALEGFMESKEKGNDKQIPAKRRGSFLAIVLPRAGDLKAATDAAVKQAVDRLKDREAKEGIAAEPIKDKSGAASRQLTANGIELRRTRLEVKVADDPPFWYVDLAVANLPGGTLVLVGECPWDKRDYWEQEFGALFHSVQRIKDPESRPPKEKARPAAPEGEP
jgi:hypothetical protein